jgi:HSP20 family protein
MADTDPRSLDVQEKKELAGKDERTIPARYYVPDTDIYETADALVVVMEMPGVEKGSLDIGIEEDTLHIEGHIDLAKYAEMEPLYTEYNVGHYSRNFTLSSKIDRDKITAETKDGVLTLTLPKAKEAKPRKIKIN